MAARGSTVMQFAPSEVYQSATPPDNPETGKLWRNSAVKPGELLCYNGKGVTNARSYAASKSGVSVLVEDLSDNRAMIATVKTIAPQAGTGTPSPTNIRAISGKASAKVVRTGKNILKPGTTMTSAGVAMTVAADGTVTLNGTCTGAAGTPTLFTVQMGVFLNGQFTFSANNPAAHGSDLQMRLMQDGSSQVSSPLTNFALTSIGSKLTFTLSNQYVWGYAIRVGGDVTYNNVIIRPQLEAGADAAAFETCSWKDCTLTPDATLYGLTGAEDEIGNDGHVIHKTKFIEIDGTETWTWSSTGGGVFYSSDAKFSNFVYNVRYNAICSHYAVQNYSNNYSVAGSDNTSGRIHIKDNRYADAPSFKAYLAAQKTAGTPVRLVHKLETPTTTNVASAQIIGGDFVNVLASDSTTLSVAYTGSGWDTVGAVQRVTVESVKISPEEGLRVDTILSSANGAYQVPTFFNARGSRYGLFRTSDGTLILGGMVLPNGQPAGVAEALVSPGESGDTRIGVETSAAGAGAARVDTAAIRLVQPSFAGATDPNVPTGEKIPVKIESVRSTLINGQGQYVDNYSTSFKALDALRLIAMGEGGSELAWLLVQRSPEGSTIYTDGAYSASDSARTLSNFAPMIHMSAPTSESIIYNATTRRYMLDWKTINDDYSRYATFKGGNSSFRDVGIIIQESGYYRFAFLVELSQASTSSGVTLHINRMPTEWTPPTNRDYCLDTDLTPTRLTYRRATNGPLNATVTTCEIVADMWCFGGEKILPVVAMEAVSKTLVSTGTFFTAQKIG